jgi:hypothetical protein
MELRSEAAASRLPATAAVRDWSLNIKDCTNFKLSRPYTAVNQANMAFIIFILSLSYIYISIYYIYL